MNKRNLLGLCMLAGVMGGLAVACADTPTAIEDRLPEPNTPVFAEVEPFNDIGACMGNDVLSYNALVPSSEKSSWGPGTSPIPPGNYCTAKEIYLANAVVTGIYDEDTDSFVPVTGPITCNEGEWFRVTVEAQIAQNAASERTDLGVWIGQPDPSDPDAPMPDQAVDGFCAHYNLVPGLGGSVSLDGDLCGDMNSALNEQLDLDLGELLLRCEPNENEKVEVPACIGWTVPGGDRACPFPEGADDPINWRMGTVPGSTSKCNCEPFELDIVVLKSAHLEVRKELDPTNDDGRFNLYIDFGEADEISATNQGHNGTTGKQTVSAGTSVAPGADHTFSETGFGSTSLDDYETSWECRDRGGAAASRGSGTGPGPETISLEPDDDVVCTFTNARKPEVRLKKVFDPTDDGGKVSFTIDGELDDNEGEGYGHNGTTEWYQFPVGTNVNFSEAGFDVDTDLTNYESSWACTNSASGSGTSGSTGALGAGAQVTCTFTNARKPEVRLKKVFDPTDDGGFVSFTIGGELDDNEGEGYGHNGTTEWYQFPVNTNVSFSEAGLDVDTDLDEYVSSWACDNTQSGPGISGSTGALGAGARVTCTFTNARKARLIVKKVIQGGGTQIFDFSRTGIANFQLGDGEQNDSGHTLLPGSFTVCELDLAVSWAATVTVDGAPVIPYNPDAPIEDLGNRCVDVTLAYGDVVEVEWTNYPPPGGDARTIGYWRNWSSCTGGNQFTKAPEKGMADKTLDANLPQTVGLLEVEECEDGVNILSKRDLDGANKANDGAYELAAQLLAAQLNVSADADVCPAAAQAILDGQAFLEARSFTGLGDYLRPGGSAANRALREQALSLAGILDSYNNNTLCP